MFRRALMGAGVLALATLTFGIFGTPNAQAVNGYGFFGAIAQGPLTGADAPKLREANPGSMRLLVLWNTIQSQPGPCRPTLPYNAGRGRGHNNCYWGKLDHQIGVAAAAGVRARPFVFGTPGWLKSARKGTKRQPWAPPLYSRSDRRAWQHFLRALVNRYGPRGRFWKDNGYLRRQPVRHWQIWNEPSSPAYFAPRPSARKYGRLLKISNRTIRRADRRTKIVLAGVFGTPRRRGGGIDMPDWFRRLYRVRGVKKAFDYAAVHPYSKTLRGIRRQIRLARKQMRRGGDRRTKLIITELGYSSRGPKRQTLASTRKGQARKLQRSFKLLRRQRQEWKLAGVNWFSWRDVPRNRSSCKVCPWTGLLKKGGREKPAFRRFKKFT